MDIKRDFSLRLVQALDAAGVEPVHVERKRYLHRVLDITPRHAGNYLNGEKLPTPEGMVKLAMCLGVSLDWLMTGQGLMQPLTAAEQTHLAETRQLAEPDREKVYRLSQVFLPAPPQEKNRQAS